MAIIRNILDSRIKDCADIQSFKRYDDKYIGETGYFSDSLCRFQDLKCCIKSTLVNISDDEEAGDFIFESKGGSYYRYFLPEKLLKPIQKEYRPYTLNEFINEYSLGDEVIMRRKDGSRSIEHKLFTEYIEGDIDVCFSGFWHALDTLFNDYELYTGEEWKPFGVIEVEVEK